MRLKLTIAYDGRPYQGWQSQPCGNTVQDRLVLALAAVAQQPVAIHGSGRTDSGVHALGQTAHFDVPPEISMNPHNWVPALNAHLPATIRVMACDEVAADFHARFSAIAKTYHYDLSTLPILPPHAAGMVWHRPRDLDPEALAEALSLFRGRHDFHAFAAYRGNETADTDYHRTIHATSVEVLASGYRMVVSGDGFLYKMVRMLAGAAVKAAQGRLREEDLSRLLDQPSGLPFGKCNHCAPADGLYLQEVRYP